MGGWVFTDGCSDFSLLIKSLSGNYKKIKQVFFKKIKSYDLYTDKTDKLSDVCFCIKIFFFSQKTKNSWDASTSLKLVSNIKESVDIE